MGYYNAKDAEMSLGEACRKAWNASLDEPKNAELKRFYADKKTYDEQLVRAIEALERVKARQKYSFKAEPGDDMLEAGVWTIEDRRWVVDRIPSISERDKLLLLSKNPLS